MIGVTATTPLIHGSVGDGGVVQRPRADHRPGRAAPDHHAPGIPGSPPRRLCGLCLQGRGRVQLPGTGQHPGSGQAARRDSGHPLPPGRRDDRQPGKPHDPGSGRPALPGPRSLQDRPLHQSATPDRRAGRQRPQLHHPDQPRLSLQVHLLLQAGHRRHLASPLGGERGAGVEMAGARAWAPPKLASPTTSGI